LVLDSSWPKISVIDTFVSVFSWWVEIKVKYFICNVVRNNPIDGLWSIKHLYQFQKSQEVIGKIHILPDFREFQTIYPNNNFLTSLYYKYPFSVAWKYYLEAQKIDFSFASKSSSCWTFIETHMHLWTTRWFFFPTK
jgi:hypothetical protein